MKINLNKKQRYLVLFFMAAVLGFTSCQPEDSFVNNGLTNENLDASFDIVPVEGKVNTYNLVAKTNQVLKSIWNTGDGDYIGKGVQEVSFPDAGTYTITQTAIGTGGSKATASKELVVATTDPLKGNLVQGGKFATAEDQAKWTVLNLSANGSAFWSFGANGATIHSPGGWAQEGIYQAIDVVKDREYTIDMFVSSNSGSDETWFEVYAGTSVPQSGVEYKDNKVMGLSTWDGCAKSKFSGMLSKVGCVKNDKTGTVSNVVKFAASGKIYLLIRCGGNKFTPDGITVTKVEFRGK